MPKRKCQNDFHSLVYNPRQSTIKTNPKLFENNKINFKQKPKFFKIKKYLKLIYFNIIFF